MRQFVWAFVASLLALSGVHAGAEEPGGEFAWVSYVEGAVERRAEDGATTSLDTADDLRADDRVFVGEGGCLTIVLAVDERLGEVATIRGRAEGRLCDLLAPATKDAGPQRVPEALASSVREPWDVDLGEAPRTRAVKGPMQGLYPRGKVAAPCADFLFVGDIELPEDAYFEVRIYERDPSRGKADPIATTRSTDPRVAMDESLEGLERKKRYYWNVGAFLPDGTEGETSEATTFEILDSPLKDALPVGGFRSPSARASWHLARAKTLVRKKLYLDAYREYALLKAAGGGSKKVGKELKRLEKKIGLDKTEASSFVQAMAVAQVPTNRLRLSDGRVLEGRLVTQGADAVLFESLGTRYRFPKATVSGIEATGAHPLPSAAPFVTATSKHYKLETNAGDEFTKQALEHLEAFHAAFTREIGKKLGAHRAKNLSAKIFRDAVDFRAYLAEKHADKREGQGFYSFNDSTLYMYRSFRGEEEVTWDTLYHEGAHQLLHLTCNQNPAANKLPHFWVLEAVPMYMESLEWDGKKLVVPGPNPIRIQNYKRVLKAGTALPWPRYLALTQSQFKSAEVYDQGHVLFWYLKTAEDGEYEKSLMEYVKWMLSSRGRSKAEEKTFGLSLSEVAGATPAWVASGASGAPHDRVR